MKKRGFSRLLVLMLAIAMLWMSVIPAYAEIESDVKMLKSVVADLEAIISDLLLDVEELTKKDRELEDKLSGELTELQSAVDSLGQHRIIAVNNRTTTAGNKKYNASESLRFQANTT